MNVCYYLKIGDRDWYYNYTKRKYDIMFVKYESVSKNIGFVLKWLNSEDKENEFQFKKKEIQIG